MKQNNNTAIILLNTQMGENIGAAARVMKNLGYCDLRIVSPKCDWPNEKADAMAASARDITLDAQKFDNLSDAIADIEYLFAATVRPRDILKDVITSTELCQNIPQNHKVGILFGGERSGLSNAELTLADKIVTIPTNPDCSSLNLAQSVAILCYELQRAENIATHTQKSSGRNTEINLVPKAEILGMLSQLQDALDNANYYREENKREQMNNTINNMFTRTNWTELELRAFRGVIRSLARKHK